MSGMHCIVNVLPFHFVNIGYCVRVGMSARVCARRGWKLTSGVSLDCPSLVSPWTWNSPFWLHLLASMPLDLPVLALGFICKYCTQLLCRSILDPLNLIPSHLGFPFYILRVNSLYHSYHPKQFKIAPSINFRIRSEGEGRAGRCLLAII